MRTVYLIYISVYILMISCIEEKSQSDMIKSDPQDTIIQIKDDQVKFIDSSKMKTQIADSSRMAIAKDTVINETSTFVQKPKAKINKKRPKIFFPEPVYNFGSIMEGDVIDHKFEFKNIGEAPLEIKSVDVSCGCTFPSYPFLDIAPGESGHISVRFNSATKYGYQKPKLTVKTNASGKTIDLYLEGEVVIDESTLQPKGIDPN